MKSAIYARYSSEMQRESSIEDQVRNCINFATREGFSSWQIFSDSAITGTNNNRPQYQAMLKAARAKLFDVLIVDDLSRLSRDDIELKTTLQKMGFWGIRVIGASEGFDNSRKGHKIHAGMKSLMNDIFIDDHRDKVHRGMSGQALKGLSCGGKPYGYNKETITDPVKTDPYGRPAITGVRFKINDEQSAIINEIYEWYASDHSPKWICNELNKRKIPSPGGSWWRPSSLKSGKRDGMGVLKNKIYIGVIAWNRTQKVKNPETGKFTWKMRPESEHISTACPELRIISDELWNKVQKRCKETESLAVNNVAGRRHLFSGLLKCAVCGGNFIIKTQKRYGCATHHQSGKAACTNNKTVSRSILEDNLLYSIREDLLQKEAITKFIKKVSEKLKNQKKPNELQKKKLHQDMALVDKEIGNILKAIKAGILTESTKEELERAEATKKRINNEIAILNAPNDDKLLNMLPRAADHYRSLIARMGDMPNDKIEHARAIISSIVGGTIILRPKPNCLEAEIHNGIVNLLMVSGNSNYYSSGAGGGFPPNSNSNITRIPLIARKKGTEP